MTKTTAKSKIEIILSDGLLGTMTDVRLAKRYGIYNHEASTIRRLAGIERYSKDKEGGGNYDDKRLGEIEDMLLRLAETNTQLLAKLRNKGIIE